jgi:hypothetical protein
MDDWIDELARALGEEPLTDGETTQLLDIARDVAHRVERKFTPLSAFVMGCAVGRELAAGAERAGTLSATLERVAALIPPGTPED